MPEYRCPSRLGVSKGIHSDCIESPGNGGTTDIVSGFIGHPSGVAFFSCKRAYLSCPQGTLQAKRGWLEEGNWGKGGGSDLFGEGTV
jgi:hypothetical protein